MKLIACFFTLAIGCAALAQEPTKAAGIQGLLAPEYPIVARQARIEGEVHLTVAVAETGKVIAVKSASGPDILAKSARNNILRWSYTSLGRQTEVEVTYTYRLEKPEVETNTSPVVELTSPFHINITTNLLRVTGYDEGFRKPAK